MIAIREFLNAFIAAAPDAPAPPADVFEQVAGAIADRDRAQAAARSLSAERQRLQRASIDGPIDVHRLTDAFIELDEAERRAASAVTAAEARVGALERVAHQVRLQQRRDAATAARTRLAEAAARQNACTAQLSALEKEAVRLKLDRQRAGQELTQLAAEVSALEETGRRRKDAALNDVSRVAPPRRVPMRLSEWQRLWDGAHAVGLEFVMFDIDVDTGLIVALVQPNRLPGFDVQVNAGQVGEVQR